MEIKKAPGKYWRIRCGLQYYSEALRLCRKYAGTASSVLEVGARDTLFLEKLDWIPRKVAIDRRMVPVINGAENIRSDFLTWQEPYLFDLAVCLQVLEHLKNVITFAEKLKKCCRILIVSVPYKWPYGRCRGHQQDPIDLPKLMGWFEQVPIEYRIINDADSARLIAVFVV